MQDLASWDEDDEDEAQEDLVKDLDQLGPPSVSHFAIMD